MGLGSHTLTTNDSIELAELSVNINTHFHDMDVVIFDRSTLRHSFQVIINGIFLMSLLHYKQVVKTIERWWGILINP